MMPTGDAMIDRKKGTLAMTLINGKAEVGVLGESDLDAMAGILRGLESARRGEGRSVDDVFDDLEREVA